MNIEHMLSQYKPTRRTSIGILLAPVLFAFSLPAAAGQLEVKVLAPNAVKEAVAEIAARFQTETGHTVVFTWGGSEAIFKRIKNGEVFDVVLSTESGLSRLADEGRLVSTTIRPFSRSAVAAAVRAGIPRPKLTTVEELRAALIDARTIAISSGASGRHMEKLFKDLGVTEVVQQKIVQPPSGAQISELLAKGEADLGFQQVTELLHAKGIDYIGPLPDKVQKYTVWSAGLHVAAPNPDAGRAFIQAVLGPKSADAIRRTGLEPTPMRAEAVK